MVNERMGFLPLKSDELFCILLHSAYEFEISEIAEWLDLSTSDVRRNLQMARYKLQRRGLPK